MGSYRNTYEVLIASPSDLSEERGKIVKAICEWNFEHSSQGIAYFPLLWEWNAVSTADQAPQEAINEQLLSRADFMIAAFKGRKGTPTKDYPAGTIEELSKRKGRAAVFFPKRWPSFDSNDPRYDEMNDQLRELKEFKKTVSGFPLEYDGPDDLLNNVKKTLTDWAKKDGEEAPLVMSLVSGPYDPKRFFRQAVPQGQKACALLFNSELRTLKSKEDFEKYWSFLRDMPWVEKVIFTISPFKIDRLKSYLSTYTVDIDPELLGRFFVSPQTEPTKPGPWSICSGLAFALLRYGPDPSQGTFAPLSQFAVLANPFCSWQKSPTGGPDVEWDYEYYFEFSEPKLQKELGQIWDQWFRIESLTGVSKLVADIKGKSEINNFLDKHIEFKPSPKKGDITMSDSNVILIKELKHKLFDPNVPSYLLNTKYDLLDWNNAFELVFPTTLFYRHESVKEFVECLVSKDEAKLRGKELIEMGQKDQTEGPPRFDLEQLAYRSPKYGAMSFTKIASMVIDPESGESKGWIVALNVNQAEHWGEYERDLRRMNERQVLIGEHALCSDLILSQFPGYLELARRHASALSSCKDILDLGCGPGILSAELLRSGKRVTAIDQNDAMLDAARKRCMNLPGFSGVKANLETLHRPNASYSFKKVGIRASYDGAALFNNYHWLIDPPGFLRRLADEDLLDPNGLLTISLLTGKQDVDNLLGAIQAFQENQEEEQGEDFKCWSVSDFESFSFGLCKLVDPKGNMRVIGRYGEEDVAGDLVNAGYEVIARERPTYTVGGRGFRPFAFFVAKRIR